MEKLNIKGKTFGRLTVLDFAYTKNWRSYWVFECKCGKMLTKMAKDIVNGKVISCGCAHKGANNGEKNGQWKGDKVKYGSLHDYIKYHFPKPNSCSNCGSKNNIELCNISQEYKRDLSDWEWLCRRCHGDKDGRNEWMRNCGPQKSKGINNIHYYDL